VERFKVTKTLEFSYGHRLLNYEGKCRHLHGHNGVLEVDVASDTLDHRGMVVDFGDVRDVVKTWVDEQLDHRMLLCKDDPLVPLLAGTGEPLYLMDENPTAENIAKHIYEEVQRQGLTVSEVRLWETSTGYVTYRGR
jgi:6-pyruvoyltetrahydropterin/6-carboxytetrahydropterin synthase